MSATDFLNNLNHQYLAIHRTKEDFFWDTYMGTSDDHEGSAKAQTAWTNFLSDASHIGAVKTQLDAAEAITDEVEKQQTIQGLKGWLAMFQAHAIESNKAKALKQN